MVNRRSFLTTCVVAASISGCSAPTTENSKSDGPRPSNSDNDGNWTMFRHDQKRTGYNPHADGPSRDPQLQWSYETDDAVWGSPVVSNGTVYIGSYDHNLYAISAETGEEIWTFQTSNPVDGTPAVVDGTVYFGSFDKNIYALDARTGEKRWEYSTGGLVRSSPTVFDGMVFIGTHCYYAECMEYNEPSASNPGYIYALDTQTGNEIWKYETDDEIVSSPAVVDGTVFIGSSDGKLYAINQHTGEIDWEFQTNGSIYSTPAVIGNTVYMSSNRDQVYALNRNTGERIWSFLTSANVLTGSPAVHNDVVYVGGGAISDRETNGHHSELYAISTDKGEEIWSREIPGEVIGSSPAIADGIIYFSSNNFSEGSSANPGIFAYTESGREYWKHTVDKSEYFTNGEGFGSSPAIVNDTLYIGGSDSRIYSFT